MKYGFYTPNAGSTGGQPDSLAAIARQGDQLGFDYMVFPDHVVQPNGITSPYPYTVKGDFAGGVEGGGEWMEQLTTLAFLAAVTERIQLVTSVMIVPHRPAILTAKMLATLDVLSKGRLIVGVGVGWMEEEFLALDAPPFAKRGAVTNEYLRAFKELWTSDDPTFEGEFCRFSNLKFLPKPVRKPHPPIWVGGQSRPAIRRAAQLGDAWHPVGATPATPLEPEQLAKDIATLHRFAERAGRDPADIEVAMKVPIKDPGIASSGPRRRFSGTADDVRRDIETYSALGVGHLIFDIRKPDLNQTLKAMQWFAEAIMV
ncbi:MAG: LLM class F420-dependent oxidoreductase [Dehalococcoidia bacterium]|jgi:probable F420-dependent oxidoreductase|nr:LLM class F420-dependent oxidoreductase [Dehalococcoidia bacterium]